jgi:type III secretion protein Q
MSGTMSAAAAAAPDPTHPAAHGGGAPLPSVVTPSHVSVLNAFYRRRQALTATIGGQPATIMSAWPPTPVDASDGRALVSSRVTLSLDGEEGELSLPRKLVDVLIEGVDPALSLDRLRPDRAAIVIEFALAASLDALEATLGWRLALTSIDAPHTGPARPDLVALSFALTFARFCTFICELRLAPGRAVDVIRNLDRSTGFVSADVDLPVQVSLRFAAATLTVGDVHDLSPGDVVVVDEHCGADGSAVAVIAEHLVAPIELNSAGGVLAAHPTRGCGSPWEWSMDNNKSEPSRHPVPDALGLDELPLRIVFEIGRLELSLGDIRQMAPGTVLPLVRPFDEALDIVANGRRIGRGEIVRVGDSLGVRVIRLFDNV